MADPATPDGLEPDGVSLHRMDIPVRWGDMDALGHVNNTVYFRYFEQARIGWYEAIGPTLGLSSLGSDSVGMLIVDNHAEYLRPVVYPATVTVRMGGHAPGRSSFMSTYTLAIGDELFCRGASKVVWADLAAGRSLPLPDAIRAALGDTSNA